MIYAASGFARAKRVEVRSDAEAALPPPSQGDEAHLLEALRAGDEPAFRALIQRYESAMLRLAKGYVGDFATAQDVVQEMWLAVIRGLPGFRSDASLKTWIFRILLNRARTRGRRDARKVPASALSWRGSGEEGGTDGVDVMERIAAERGVHAKPGGALRAVLDGELREQIDRAAAALPERQRVVLTMRDIEGWTADEVCNVLGISETNQRVLLHRARKRVRQEIEMYVKNGMLEGDDARVR
jgi:RNA polymerase sigma-70 factor (ECF subfamily)